MLRLDNVILWRKKQYSTVQYGTVQYVTTTPTTYASYRIGWTNELFSNMLEDSLTCHPRTSHLSCTCVQRTRARKVGVVNL